MPNVLIPLPDVYESVSRRVMVSVLQQLAQTMRLPGETQILLPGSSEALPMNGGSFGDCGGHPLRYPTDSRLMVRFNEEADEAYVYTNTIRKNEWLPIWADPDRGISIRPVYRYMTVTATLEHTSNNKTTAQRWLDDMRIRVSTLRAELYQTLQYHYAFPTPCLELLKHIHATIEASEAPLGLTLDEYIDQHMIYDHTIATTLVNTHGKRVIPEKQVDVLGWFDFTVTPPEPERDSEGGGSYTASFSYIFHYNRPTHVHCKYPMLIHNRPVDERFRAKLPLYLVPQPIVRTSATKGAFEQQLSLLHHNTIPYIHWPLQDDWVPKLRPSTRLTFFSGLLRIRSSNQRSVINLASLGEVQFTPYFLEYFYHQGDKLFDHLQSFFEFNLYENELERNDITLRFEPGTLKVVADRDLDLTKYYHIQIGLRRNWHSVSNEALETLRHYPTVAYWLLKALGVTLDGKAYRDLDLLARNQPRREPGEGSLVGDPETGGTWPWPWLEGEWETIPWQSGEWTSPYHTGILKLKALRDARNLTNIRSDNYIDRVWIGPVNVLYSHILTRPTTD